LPRPSPVLCARSVDHGGYPCCSTPKEPVAARANRAGGTIGRVQPAPATVTVESARSGDFATPELHHPSGHDQATRRRDRPRECRARRNGGIPCSARARNRSSGAPEGAAARRSKRVRLSVKPGSPEEREAVRADLQNLLQAPVAPFPVAGGRLNAPRSAGVYIVYGPDGEVLHVGQTGSLHRRG